MPGLELKNIRKKFGDFTALDDVCLNIEEGELFFLLGPSGCGKTTLLRVIAGFTQPDSGTVRFGGKDVSGVPVEKRNTGMVFQNYSLWPHMTVFDNVAYGMRMRKADSGEIRRRVNNALAMVDMPGLENRKPGALSGGQQQRVALARALVYEPRLLLLDEPLSNLDAKLRKDMRREIRRIHKSLGITMVYVTHDQEEAASMAGRIALLRDGRVVQTGTPEGIYLNPCNRYAAQFFGKANIISGKIKTIAADTVTVATPHGEITASCPSETKLTEGVDVDIMIRPEGVELLCPGAKKNVFTGKLISVEFTGAVRNLTVDTGNCEITAMEPFLPFRTPERKTGQTVQVSFQPKAAHVMTPEKL